MPATKGLRSCAVVRALSGGGRRTATIAGGARRAAAASGWQPPMAESMWAASCGGMSTTNAEHACAGSAHALPAHGGAPRRDDAGGLLVSAGGSAPPSTGRRAVGSPGRIPKLGAGKRAPRARIWTNINMPPATLPARNTTRGSRTGSGPSKSASSQTSAATRVVVQLRATRAQFGAKFRTALAPGFGPLSGAPRSTCVRCPTELIPLNLPGGRLFRRVEREEPSWQRDPSAGPLMALALLY